MNASKALELLRESMTTHGLHDWHGELDNARRRFGVCKLRNKVISISRPLCELNVESEVRDTILHEIAHALAWRRHGENCGHDHRWKAICKEVGARPVACYDGEDVVVPEAPWILAHKETGEVFRSYYKRPTRNLSKSWIRGRKNDTFGMLEIRPSGVNPGTANSSERTENAATTNGVSQARGIENNTMTIESFDKHTIEKMQYEALRHLETFAKQRGLEVVLKRNAYNDYSCDLTFRFQQPTPEGLDRQKIEFCALASLFDLNDDDYLKPFTFNGKHFRLCGIKPNNRKYPIIAMDDNDQKYKFEASVLDRINREVENSNSR